MKWNLRLAAAQRDIWKASQLHGMLISRRRSADQRREDVALVVESAGDDPAGRLADHLRGARLVLDDTPFPARTPANPVPLRAAAGEAPIQRRHTGRSKPPV
jgi:putative transcriptional regulator